MSNEMGWFVLAAIVVAALGFALDAIVGIKNGIHRIATVLEELDKKKEGE